MNNEESKTDEMLVEEIINGKTNQYEILINRYEQKLIRYIVYLIHNQDHARDAVQETFIKAYINLKSFKPKYKFSSWIYRIAHNEAINIVKKNKNISDKDIDTLPELAYNARLEEIMDSKILKNDIKTCLDKLDLKYREVVQLIYLENMKYEQVSDILKIPTSTVGVRLARAKAKLKSICENKEKYI